MNPRRLLSSEPFDGLEGLFAAIDGIARRERLTAAVEARALPVDRTLRPHFEIYEETLSDGRKALVAVVVA